MGINFVPSSVKAICHSTGSSALISFYAAVSLKAVHSSSGPKVIFLDFFVSEKGLVHINKTLANVFITSSIFMSRW